MGWAAAWVGSVRARLGCGLRASGCGAAAVVCGPARVEILGLGLLRLVCDRAGQWKLCTPTGGAAVF